MSSQVFQQFANFVAEKEQIKFLCKELLPKFISAFDSDEAFFHLNISFSVSETHSYMNLPLVSEKALIEMVSVNVITKDGRPSGG